MSKMSRDKKKAAAKLKKNMSAENKFAENASEIQRNVCCICKSYDKSSHVCKKTSEHTARKATCISFHK